MFCKSLILVQMTLHSSNNVSSSMQKNINLFFLFLSLSQSLFITFLTYPLILDNIETNGLIISYQYRIKYLKLLLVLINF